MLALCLLASLALLSEPTFTTKLLLSTIILLYTITILTHSQSLQHIFHATPQSILPTIPGKTTFSRLQEWEDPQSPQENIPAQQNSSAPNHTNFQHIRNGQ